MTFFTLLICETINWEYFVLNSFSRSNNLPLPESTSGAVIMASLVCHLQCVLCASSIVSTRESGRGQ